MTCYLRPRSEITSTGETDCPLTVAPFRWIAASALHGRSSRRLTRAEAAGGRPPRTTLPSMVLHPLAAQFASVADVYERGRPEYAPAVVGRTRRRARSRPRSSCAGPGRRHRKADAGVARRGVRRSRRRAPGSATGEDRHRRRAPASARGSRRGDPPVGRLGRRSHRGRRIPLVRPRRGARRDPARADAGWRTGCALDRSGLERGILGARARHDDPAPAPGAPVLRRAVVAGGGPDRWEGGRRPARSASPPISPPIRRKSSTTSRR